jgi:hypothetical protein
MESTEAQLFVWSVKMPSVFTYTALVVVLIGIAVFDVYFDFRPIGLSIVFGLMAILAFYRPIINKYLSPIFIGWQFLFTGAGLILFCVVASTSLNRQVDIAAQEAITSIYRYKEVHGEFPNSLLDIAPAESAQEWARSRIKFGARYYYVKRGATFNFGFSSYPFGRKVWNPATRKFTDSMD